MEKTPESSQNNVSPRILLEFNKDGLNTAAPTIDPANLLDFYWNFYNQNADQRMRLLNHFIVVIMAMFVGAFTIITSSVNAETGIEVFNPLPWILLLLVGMFFISEICFWLDVRTTNQLHVCREAIRELEKTIQSPQCPGDTTICLDKLKIFTEMSKRSNEHRESPLVNYQEIFTLVYRGFGCFACCGILYNSIAWLSILFDNFIPLTWITSRPIAHLILACLFGFFLMRKYIYMITEHLGASIVGQAAKKYSIKWMRLQKK